MKNSDLSTYEAEGFMDYFKFQQKKLERFFVEWNLPVLGIISKKSNL